MSLMNPMFYGTFAFLAFSSFFIIGGLWLVHGIKKDQREREAAASASTAAPESRSRFAG
jgi:hypothetical protein